MSNISKKSVLCMSCNAVCVRWGKASSGVIRYRCRSCGKTQVSSQSKRAKTHALFSWFRLYVLRGITYDVLSEWSRIPVRTLEEAIHRYLKQDPPTLTIPQPQTDEAYLLLDGLWFGRKTVLMLYRQSGVKLILRATFMPKEWGRLIAKDLELLKETGYRFTVVVSDGGTGIEKAIVAVYGHIPHQICLAHLHRLATGAIGKKPKDDRVKELKALADHLWLIESKEALRWWQDQVSAWVQANWWFLHERRRDTQGHSWFVHVGVRKALRTILTAGERSFVFLDHPLMPKTTNELEASIGNLSMKHVIHRGLKRERTADFLKWFIYFYNQKLLSQSKGVKD